MNSNTKVGILNTIIWVFPFLLLFTLFFIFIMHSIIIYPALFVEHNSIMPVFTNIVDIKTSDGIKQKIYIIDIDSDVDIVFFGGNGMNAKWLSSVCKTLSYLINCNVISIIYRGYNGNEGKPNEVGLMLDTHAVYEYIKKERSDKKIVCMGLSLGCSLALYLAELLGDSFDKICILENGFYNMQTIVKEALGTFSWLSFLITEEWQNDRRILKLGSKNVKFLFLISSNDEIIGNHHSDMMINLLDGKCEYERFSAFHMTACEDPKYYAVIKTFIENKFD
ncbi:Protein bem46 [Astathelohania contejeani]|uniref:Protein bem46 n=1 Tax=Astathelohania contejeani TaxID=164912 RepID=A0ABQ7HZD6_9MICR|nr:Protein bem46 [Thelohania contejeani]